MAQASITSFFSGAPKRKAQSGPKQNEPPVKAPKLPAKSAAKHSLGSFTRGNDRDPNFYADAANQKRHEMFRKQLGVPNRGAGAGRRSMKPYDLQFIELKRQNMDAILMIQNGYKYQVLGDDAYQAARFLGRSPVSGWRSLEDAGDGTDALYDRFASITFPIERLSFYVEKLIAQGLKVAVAKQLETSALKALGENKRGPFRREVTDMYTKGTMVEELTASSTVSGHVLALFQNGSSFALVACQPATGSTVYDSFEDSGVVMELETRLLHIQPSEVLLVGSDLGAATAKLIESLDVRVVRVGEVPDSGSDASDDMPEAVRVGGLRQCWTALYNYLAEFNLEKALALDAHSFSLQSSMYLNGDTLNSLEIFRNQTTWESYGSLVWALDVTSTPFGRRLLRNWIGKPLLDRGALEERVEAMEEIMASKSVLFTGLRQSLGRMPDLERYTLQIFHGRIAPKQLYWCLYFFHQLVNTITQPQIVAAKLRSPLLESLLSALPRAKETIDSLLQRINAANARNDRDGSKLASYFVFEESNDSQANNADLVEIDDLQLQIATCRSDFDRFLHEESERLGMPLKQVNALGEEDTFVIGIPKKNASKVPPSWRRQGATTLEVRYWAPYSMEQTKVLKPLLERLDVAAKQAYSNFVKEIAQNHFELLRAVVSATATIDCLFSLAQVSSRPGYVKPDIVDTPCLDVVDGRHPMLEQIRAADYIANSVRMFSSENRVMIITGANMGGKSSFVRQVALIVIMAQVGCYVPASHARISIMDAVFTRMGAFDNLLKGESTFMVELKECSTILSCATPRSLVLLDEIGRGTSTMDGVAIAYAVLKSMIEDVKSFTLFITHYPSLCELADEFENRLVQNWSMDCVEDGETVTFLYKIVQHQALRSNGINVARLAELPADVLAIAAEKAAEMEAAMQRHRGETGLLRETLRTLSGAGDPAILMSTLESDDCKRFEEVPETQCE